MVCRGNCPDESQSTAQPPDEWFPNVSSAIARLRAFSLRAGRDSGHTYPVALAKKREVGRSGYRLADDTLGDD